MKLKSIMKKTAACLAAMGCLCLDVTAYGADNLFSSFYSGKLAYSNLNYITISREDVVLTKVILSYSVGERFVSIDTPSHFLFNDRIFDVDYGRKGQVTLSDGTPMGETLTNVYISTTDVVPDYGLFFILKSVDVGINDRTYSSK